jgi:sulfhydrogenase subunit beta (sulfur reductase)
MTEKLIAHTNIDRLLGALAEQGSVWAPRTEATGDVLLRRWRPADPITLEYANLLQSPRGFFLPQQQTLLRFSDGAWTEPPLPEVPTYLFGARPCDARALELLDRVFLGDGQPDPYYARLRDRTTVIAMACRRPASSCFCASVGGGPGDATGSDVLAVPLETDLLLRAHGSKGERLLASVADLLAEASPEAIEASADLIAGAASQLAPVRTDDSARRLGAAFDSPMWDAAGQKCLGCGACSYLCPTCHCFDITDEGDRRLRTWDCCAYPQFTLHASGHNPRPTPRERWRQRVMHKFRYAVENLGVSFCVGCGRCIRNCPAGMDLRTALKDAGD